MAEFNRLPTQAELDRILFQQSLGNKTTQQIINENLAGGGFTNQDNVMQRMATGAGIAKQAVNKLGTAADVAKLFPGYTGQTKINIPTGYNFAPKMDPYSGQVGTQGLQTQSVPYGDILKAIKPADVLGISGAESAYSDIGAGKAPQPMDVVDTLGLGAGGIAAGKGLLKAGVKTAKYAAPAAGRILEQYAADTGLLSPLIAYHGSPHLVDKFDINKIGTGEGSQAYGHGMYYAEYMPTAKTFSLLGSSPGLRQGTSFANEQSKLDAAVILNAKKFTSGNVNELADVIKKHPAAFAEPEKMLTRINEYIDNKAPSYLYKVDIPDKAVKTFLDWDNPISTSQQGIKALQKINKKYNFEYDNSFTGGDLYKALTVDFMRTGKAANEKEAQKLVSNELNKIGIKGIQHIDPNARDFKNYVVFDPATVKIIERNNKRIEDIQGSIKPAGLLNVPTQSLPEQPSFNQNLSQTTKPVNLQALANEAMWELRANPSAANKQKYLEAKEKASQEFVALRDAPEVAKVTTEIQDYKGQHTAPMKDSGKPLWDLSGIYPDDFYSSQGARYYGHGEDLARDSRIVSQIQSFKGHPDRPVIIYRAVPKDIEKGKSLNAGDWITTDRQYAKEHGESALGGNYKIIKKTVKARDIYTNGDSIYEFGYDPQPFTPKSQR